MAVSAVKKEPAKAQQAAPATAPAPAAEARPGKKKAMLLYAAIALVALGGGGGTWWYLDGDATPGSARPQPVKPPVFAPLDTFTVNLQAEEGNQFLQVGLTLRLVDEPAVAALKLRMPEVRDRILLLLSSKKASELLTLEGKRKLSAEIQAAVNAILVPASAQPADAPAGSPAAAAPAPAAAAAAPTPAPSAPAADAPGDAAAEPQAQAAPGAETAAAPQEPAAVEPAQAPAAPAQAQAAPATPVLPVTGVLFTSFIIQ
jgi:flagellar protein FliL